MKNKFQNIVIVILIIIIVLSKMFEPQPTNLKEYIKIGGKKYELLSKNIDTIYLDSIVYIPEYKPVFIDSIVTVEVPQDVDTLAILKDYYSKYVYLDTIPINSIGFAYISDVIFKNRIHSRAARFDYKIPVIKQSLIIKELPKNKVFVGLTIGMNRTTFLNHTTVNVLLLNKRDRMYSLGVGIKNEQQTIVPFVQGSIYWKIKLKK